MSLALQAAAMWGVPPTVYLEQWSARDRGLAEGHILEQNGLCPCGCGYPTSLTQSPHTQGQWDVVRVVCTAREALEQDHTKADDEEPGLMKFAVLKSDYQPPRLGVLNEQRAAMIARDRGDRR